MLKFKPPVHARFRAREGFTLIELLTVIAIMGILAAILIPTVGRVRETARRTVDASNIRQIAQAALLYAADHNERLPSMKLTATGDEGGAADATMDTFAAALARGGSMNNAQLWLSGSDPHVTPTTTPTVVVTRDANGVYAMSPEFLALPTLSYQAVAGLVMGLPPSTPIVFTRGLNALGSWTTANGVYGADGGHIAFLGGNVAFYRDLIGNNGLQQSSASGLTVDIHLAIRAANPPANRQILAAEANGEIVTSPGTGL